MNSNLEIFMINHNSAWFTNLALHTLHKKASNLSCHVTVFDNSSKDCRLKIDSNLLKILDISILDNTDGKIIDFSQEIKQLEAQVETGLSKNGSFKHALTVDFWLYHMCTSPRVLLLDNDVLLKRDIDFIDDASWVIADVEKPFAPNKVYGTYRFYPFIQYINLAKIKEKNIHYFDPERIIHGKRNTKGNPRLYDTGGSFFEDIVSASIPFKRINHLDYIYHYGSGSWNATQEKTDQWTRLYFEIMKQP